MNALLRHFIVLLLGVTLVSGLEASTFQINPTRITLSKIQSVSVLTVRNESETARVMQLQVMSWEQQNGENHYEATRELLATPPIFTIPPGGTQIVRVGLRRQPDKLRELSYRLFLQEVPIESASTAEVKVTLRFGIPVFVAPLEKNTHPLLAWRVVTTPDQALRIEATNHGRMHVQVTGFYLQDATNQAILAEYKRMYYLLPEQRHVWLVQPIYALPPGASIKITGQTDAGEVSAEAVLED